MNKGKDIYHADYSEYLPGVLQLDPKMQALASMLAKQLLDVSGILDNVLIYSKIDELPEVVVDVLAYDMHIDWYDYTYPLEVKRNLIKSSVQVHKKMGTKYAIEKALGSVHPGSTVEEWFEYSGEPHHFRVICDMTGTKVAASYLDILRAVHTYKRLSSQLDAVTYQARIQCLISSHTDCYKYTTPYTGRLKAGTYPERSTKSVTGESVLYVGTEAAGFAFVSPAAGTKPQRNIVYGAAAVQIDAETVMDTYMYSTPVTNDGTEVSGSADAESFRYATKLCGSKRKL